ncbi:hypothetical protein [Citrobacter pasteurii]|nr:hypothetical protein [Citrobacter pasteurii]
MVVLVLVDENPEELVQRCGLAIHGRAQVVVTVDDFAVQFGAQAFLLNVPHADGFQVGTDAHPVQVDFQIWAHTDFQPGFVVEPEITHLNSATRVLEQHPGGWVLEQGFLNGQCSAQLLAGDQYFSLRILAPRIQQFVGEDGIRINRLNGLNQICFGTGNFQGLRLLHFLCNQIRINHRQLLEQCVTTTAGSHLWWQGGVVLFDAGFHRRCGLFLVCFDTLEPNRQRHVTLTCFFQRCAERHLLRQGGVVFFQQHFDIVG